MMIKKTGIVAAALMLSSIFATAAQAYPADLAACTRDGKTAVLKINVEGTVGQPARALESVVQAAFAKTANSLTADQLVGPAGVQALHDNLAQALRGAEVSKDASLDYMRPIILAGAPGCTVK
jgi:hypothetical protein